MHCPHCGRPSRIVGTEEVHPGVTKVTNLCTIPTRVAHPGATFTTYMLAERFYRAAQFDIKKAMEASQYHAFIKDRATLRERMTAERLAGASCPELAEKYKMSVDMVRYYTRQPRARLYPAVKRRANGNHSAGV